MARPDLAAFTWATFNLLGDIEAGDVPAFGSQVEHVAALSHGHVEGLARLEVFGHGDQECAGLRGEAGLVGVAVEVDKTDTRDLLLESGVGVVELVKQGHAAHRPGLPSFQPESDAGGSWQG